jgi:cytochrome c biogenesis protein CcmG/thiol:disulfide interchange protein DsbE
VTDEDDDEYDDDDGTADPDASSRRRPEPGRGVPWRLAGWALFALFVVVWAGQNAFQCGPESALVGRPSPAFEGVIVAGDGVGDRISRQASLGRPVLLDFWASWCAPCRASIPIVSRLARAHAAAGLITVGVNIEWDRPVRHVVLAHRSLGGAFPTLQDEAGRMQQAFGVTSIPTLVLIDRRGVVRRVEVGMPDEGRLDAQIREIAREVP